MKKGISLIVLIITIVVIIVLATAIIVNIAQTNIINNAKEATLKQDFKTLQEELNLYIADKYTDKLGKYNVDELDVTDKSEIRKIIPSIKNTKYEDYVVIENGKIAISDTMPEPDKTWALEALNNTNISSSKPVEPDTVAPTVPTILELTATDVSITAVANGSIDNIDTEVKYQYSMDGTTWKEDGLFEGLQGVTAYTIYARALDNAGNESEIIQESITTKEPPITASIVANNAKTYYGKSITNYEPNNNSSVGWKIFHSDEENIYLIADTAVPVEELPYTTDVNGNSTTNKPTSLIGYGAAISTVIGDYEGSSRIREEVKYLNYDYCITKGYTNTTDGLKAAAYMLDNIAWDVFGSQYSKFVIGGPTLELLFDSYNKNYGTEYECTASSTYGYSMRKASTDSWARDMSGAINTSDSLYHTPSTVILLASPSGTDKWLVLEIDSGTIKDQHLVSANYGYRPVVCLNSDVKLEASGEGYAIVK